MKYIKIYDSQAKVVGQTEYNPSEIAIRGFNKALYIPKLAEETVTIIKDVEDPTFIDYKIEEEDPYADPYADPYND